MDIDCQVWTAESQDPTHAAARGGAQTTVNTKTLNTKQYILTGSSIPKEHTYKHTHGTNHNDDQWGCLSFCRKMSAKHAQKARLNGRRGPKIDPWKALKPVL